MKKVALVLFCAIGMLMAIGPSVSLAEKSFPDTLEKILPILHKDNQESCKVCHTQVKNPDTGKKDPKWNVFGEAMKSAREELKKKNNATPNFEEMFNAVKDLDSDGDGASNIVELVAGSKPGDKESKPSDEAVKEAQAKIDEMNKKAGGDAKPAPEAPKAE